MRTLLLMLALVGGFLSSGCYAADAPVQKSVKLEAQLPVNFAYLLALPADYDKKDAWPVVIFLHGAGERGDDLNLVKKHGPPRLAEEGKSFPFIVVSPQCPKDNWWHWQLGELNAFVDDVIARYKVDKDRVYLTGLSMGGFGTWALAARSPEKFAAIVPICGGGEIISTRRLTQMPIWAFHGAKDPVVPLRRSEELMDVLKKSNSKAKFTVYPDAQHDSWTETYNNPELYSWLLEQKRAPAATP